MKKIIGLLMALVLLVCSQASAEDGRIYTQYLFGSATVGEAFASGVAEYSAAIDMNDYKPGGYVTLQVYLDDADGSITLEWEVSHDGINFTEPLDENGTRVPNILTSFAFNHGKATDGREMLPIPVPTMGRYVRIKATPSAHVITGLTVIIGIQ